MDIQRNDEVRADRLTAREVDEMGHEHEIILEMAQGDCAYREIEYRPAELRAEPTLEERVAE